MVIWQSDALTSDMSIRVAFEDESSLELQIAFADPDLHLVCSDQAIHLDVLDALGPG